MRTIKPMTGKHLANWLRKKGAEDLGAVFEDNVAEAYDHLKLEIGRAHV